MELLLKSVSGNWLLFKIGSITKIVAYFRLIVFFQIATNHDDFLRTCIMTSTTICWPLGIPDILLRSQFAHPAKSVTSDPILLYHIMPQWLTKINIWNKWVVFPHLLIECITLQLYWKWRFCYSSYDRHSLLIWLITVKNQITCLYLFKLNDKDHSFLLCNIDPDLISTKSSIKPLLTRKIWGPLVQPEWLPDQLHQFTIASHITGKI